MINGVIADADEASPEFLPRPTDRDQVIAKLLDEQTEVDFSDTPLREVCQFLGDYHKLNFVFDHWALQDEGIDPLVPVTMTVTGVKLRTALKLMLSQLGLTCVVEDEVLKITTLEVVESKLVARVYPVGDLAENAEELDQLLTAIEAGTGEWHWRNDEHPRGGIVPVPLAKALVIRQNLPMHDNVVDLLRSLRAARKLATRDAAAAKLGDNSAVSVPENSASAPLPVR